MNARSLAIARSVAVISGTAVLVGGVTFAAFTTNTASLTGTTLGVNEITDTLRIYDFSNPAGFKTTSDNPGGTGPIHLDLTLGKESAKQHFYLQNTGATDLGLTAMASGTPAGGLDPAKVKVRFYDDAATPNLLGEGKLSDLEGASGVALDTEHGALPAGAAGNSNNLGHGQVGNYQVSFELMSSASGDETLSGVNIDFTGTPLEASPSPTPTPSPTTTPTPSPSPSESPSPSPSPSESPTPTPSPSESPEPTATPSALHSLFHF